MFETSGLPGKENGLPRPLSRFARQIVLSGFAAPAVPIAVSQARQRLRANVDPGSMVSRVVIGRRDAAILMLMTLVGVAAAAGCDRLGRHSDEAGVAISRAKSIDGKTAGRFQQAKKRAWRRVSKPSKGERCLVPRPGERCPVARAGVGQALSGTRRGAIMFSGRRMSASMASSSKPSSRTSSSTPRPLSRAMRAIRVAFS